MTRRGQKVARNALCPCGSGKKYKHCHWVSDQPQPIPYAEEGEIEAIFGDAGKVELTDELIAELVARGWPEKDLLWARSAGMKYSTIRDSLL